MKVLPVCGALANSVVVWLSFAVFMGWGKHFGLTQTIAFFVAILGLANIAFCAWKTHHLQKGLVLAGLSLLLTAGLIFQFIPKMVNNGSGQDAVDLACYVVSIMIGALACALLLGAAFSRPSTAV